MGKRNAVVVTHRRVRSSGNLVNEAVQQLQTDGFQVDIIDNIEAPEFGQGSQQVSDYTEIVIVLG